MRRFAFLLVLGIAACGGGSSSSNNSSSNSNGNNGGTQPPSQLTTQQLLEQCLASDLTDLSTLIATVQGLLDAGSGGPQPEFNLVGAILTGVLPWTVDLDGDQVDDLSGTIFLTDANGGITIPPSLITLLGGGGTFDIDTVLALLPDGTNLNLTFAFNDLALAHGASGDGDFAAEVNGGMVTGVSGGGSFMSGDCDFQFDFDGLGPEILEGGGFGSGNVGFDLAVGTESVGGSIVLDGTNVAEVTASRAGGAPETFLVDLTTGTVTPK